jgi:hypothetical protein
MEPREIENPIAEEDFRHQIRQDLIKEAVKKLKDNGYKPTAIWQDGDNIYIVTDNIDRSKYAKLIKKLK